MDCEPMCRCVSLDEMMSQTWVVTIHTDEDLSSDDLVDELEFYVGEVDSISQLDGPQIPNEE